MPAKAKSRPSTKSTADAPSTVASSHTSSLSSIASTRTPSPSPSPSSPSTHQAPLLHHSPDHLFANLRQRRTASNSRTASLSTPTMFQSRKYSPLPTSSAPRKRAGGGAATWKRWIVVAGVAVLIVVGLGYTRLPSRHTVSDDEAAWEAEHTYTPNLDDIDNYDENNYESPPFRPEGGKLGPETDEEEDQEMHILPVEHGSPHEAASSPHDPEDAAAQDAADAEEDFTEVKGNTPPIQSSTAGTPMSFEEDEDPSSTVVCAEPYDQTRPLVQYALTIDAGSTGSRIHVYKFHNCGPSPQLEYETFKMLNPGLSSFKRDPTAAAASLDPLLEEAKRVVPKELWSCTPVEVKATAGLRLLGESESVAILDEVRNRLETETPFVVSGDKAVEIMDGKDEGVYAWITANYLLSKIGEGVKTTDTLAVMDLGGASTQIVFEPKFKADSQQQLAEGEHKYLLTFGGKQYTLYQHSYLGYGLMRARRSVHNLVAFTWSFGQSSIDWDGLNEETRVPNPCLSAGTTRTVELDPPGRTAVNVTMHGANGGFEACNRVIELVMAKDAICEVKPCSFNGVYQPSLLDTFPRGQLLALSYFTDRIKPLLPPSRSATLDTLSISELTTLAKNVCAGPASWSQHFGSNPTAMAELEDRPEYCLDLTFMHALLGLGYELSPERELMVEKKLNGVELGWALGAGLALVQNAKLQCEA